MERDSIDLIGVRFYIQIVVFVVGKFNRNDHAWCQSIITVVRSSCKTSSPRRNDSGARTGTYLDTIYGDLRKRGWRSFSGAIFVYAAVVIKAVEK